MVSLIGGCRPLASALDLADRQFSELAELPSLELEHLPGHIVLEMRESSVSVVGGYLERSMLLSAFLLLPAGAGDVTQSGSTLLEVTHVDL